MNRTLYLFVLVALLIGTSNAQHNDPGSYDVIKAPGTITLDGNLNEPAWNLVPSTLVFGPGAPTTTTNLAVTGGLLVKVDSVTGWIDTSYTYLKVIKSGMNLYVGFTSNDKSVCRWGDSWEGDGLFMKIKNAAGEVKEYKLYFNAGGANPEIVFEHQAPGAGFGVKAPGTIVNDTTQVDSGYTAEMVIYLDSLGFNENTKQVDVLFNIFDPDGYHDGMVPWGPRGSFHKTWWGSEWDIRKTLTFKDDPATITALATAAPLVIDGNLDEPSWNYDFEHLLFGPGAVGNTYAKTVTGGTQVKEPWTDTTFTTLKVLRNGMKLYIGFTSNDKSVCKFGNSWEGDGLFMKIKNAANENKEYKLYFNAAGPNPDMVFEHQAPGNGVGVKGSTTVVNDTTQIDNGYSAEMVIYLDSLGYTSSATDIPVSINIFDPDGYHDGMAEWGILGGFNKTWWGSEWDASFRNIILSNTLVLVEDNAAVTPSEFSLGQNYPNPFNPTSRIDFTLAAQSNVTVQVYNLLGQLVMTLASGQFEAGTHSLNLNASNLSSGVYLYTLNAIGAGSNFTATKKMIVLK